MSLSSSLRRFFFSPFDPASLGVFRILLGLFIAVVFIALAPNWAVYYGPGGLRPEPAGANGWSVFIWTQGWVPIGFFWWLGLASSLSFALGWNTRLFTLILFILQSSMNHADPMAVHGDDLLIRMLLFYGIFAPLGECFSVDSYRRERSRRMRPRIWPLRLMQINIAAIYAFSLPQKLMADPSWSNGEALYWVMMSTLWNRWPIQKLFYHGILSAILTYSTVLVEGLFPILVWFRRTRLPILAVISLFHIGLAILLQNVTFFSLSMVCSFTVFVPSSRIRSWIGLCRHRLQALFTGGFSNEEASLEAPGRHDRSRVIGRLLDHTACADPEYRRIRRRRSRGGQHRQ